ncbi:MAG: ABC transporter substrate-binding protein [Anaerolineaceae bacterium]
MKTIKFITLLLTALLMISTLPGCANNPATTPEVSAPVQPAETEAAAQVKTEAPTEVPTEAPVVAEKPDKLVIWTNLTAEAQTKVLTKQFTEIADEMGVEVEMEAVPFKDMYTKLATAVESGNVPDIMHTNFAGAAYLYSQDMIADMDDVIDEIGRDDFIPTYLRVLTVDDKTWGVPDWALHTSVWYRKDLFEEKGLEIPTDWDEFEAVAQALTIDENNDGNPEIYGFPVPMNPVQVAPQTYYEFLYSAGVYTFDPTTGEYVFGGQKEKAAEVLDYLINLYKTVSPPSSTEWSWNEYRNALVEGTVAMTLDMGAVIGLSQTNNPDMVEKLGRFDFPGQNGTKPASFGSGYAFVVSNQGSEGKVKFTKDFMTKLYTPERAAERALSRPMFAFPSLYSALNIYKQNESVALFQEEISTIMDAFENSNWYWYGMEHGLSQMSSQIEATTFFGEAMQNVALEQWSSEEAVDYIDENLQEQITLIE